jgi:hypothetical protein
MDAGGLSAEDWYWTDEQLLEHLRAHPSTKDAIIGEYFGRLPVQVFSMQLHGQLEDYGLKNRQAAKELIENVASETFSEHRVLGYALIDRGNFQKALQFVDPIDGSHWSEGINSRSIILHCFVRGVRFLSPTRAHHAAQEVLAALQVKSDRVMRLKFGRAGDTEDAQGKFDFATA